MASQYHSLFTAQGLELLREAIQNGTKLGITHMSYGDGNGILPIPDASFTAMVNEVYRTQLNRLAPSKENPNWLEADGVIPSAVGGFNIREVGLWAGNVMVAYANYPPTYKPSADQGTAQIKTIRIVLQIDNTANFELKIDANVVMATIRSVEEAKQDAINYADETKIHNLNCISDLANLENLWNGRTVHTKGYYEATNFALAQPFRGGGTRIYVEARKNENDGFLCINGWVLQVENNTVTPEHAGAVGDGITDDSDALQKVFLSEYSVSMGYADYAISKPVYYYSNKVISGSGEFFTSITKTTNTKLNLGNKTIGNKQMNFDVDAILVAIPKDSYYSQNNRLKGFTCKYSSKLTTRGIGLYAPLLALSSYKNLVFKNCAIGIKSVDCWMFSWERVQCDADAGWVMGARDTAWTANNTSNTFTSCWSTNTTTGNYAWNIYSMQYSTMIACGNDHIGRDNAPAEGVYRFISSDVSLINCGSEQVHAYTFLHSEESIVNIKTANFQTIFNKYKNGTNTWNTVDASIRALSNSTISISQSRLEFQFDSTHATYGANCTALAFVEGGSSFTYSDKNTVVAKIEEIALTASFAFNKHGIYHASASYIDIETRTDKYHYATTNPSGRQKELLNPLFIERTSRSISSKEFSLGNVTLDSLRSTYNNCIFVQGASANATTANKYPEAGVGYLIQQMGGGGNNNYTAQLALPVYSSDGINSKGNIYYRVGSYGVALSTWFKLYSTFNTTVTADGTLKVASPIVKLFSDHIECNEEALEQNPVFEKVGSGQYLIKNTLGFSTKGWWINIPTDTNGNKICAINYQTLENGDIEIKTYKRKFDIETASIVADESQPIDIPENMNGEQRWIDIRLNPIFTEEIKLEL